MTPEEQETTSKGMKSLAEVLDKILNGKGTPQYQKQYGFALLVYPIGQPDAEHINYIGNCGREDVHIAIRTLEARWEGVKDAETCQ